MKIPDLHSAEVQSQSDAQLAEVIGNGKNSMPPFKESLSPEQIHDLVTHVRQLSQKKWAHLKSQRPDTLDRHATPETFHKRSVVI